MQKKFIFEDNKISVSVQFATDYKKSLTYINEWNLHFPNIKNIKINEKILKDELKFFSNKLIIKDKILNKTLIFEFKIKIEIFIFALNTISQSEEGVEITTQGVSFGFVLVFKNNFKFNYDFEILKY